ncbi:hypothetical protein Godav_026071, partial [Gossypium davidsonii]|nr:hypothetical protein [Gossypium davidsonii]
EEYYINLHVGGKFVRDPHVRYLGGEVDNLRVVWNDSNTIDMINYWVKLGEINLYVDHEIDAVVFIDDESMLVVACLQLDGDGNKGGEGGEVVGNKGGEGEGEGVGEGGEVVEGLGGEGDDVAVSEGDESDGGGEEGVDVTVSEGGESDGGGKKGVRDESDSDSEDESAYLMKVMYLPDGDDDEEL